MAICGYDIVKTFCATRREDRELLGERLTAWLAEHPQLEVVAIEVRQTSDRAFHCLTFFTFLRKASK